MSAGLPRYMSLSLHVYIQHRLRLRPRPWQLFCQGTCNLTYQLTMAPYMAHGPEHLFAAMVLLAMTGNGQQLPAVGRPRRRHRQRQAASSRCANVENNIVY